ncbi:hypothetical protein T484DRAFT_1825609 [Baffinella frigidus]|nr:hypothetical protein T484DRAFT_1825609 [Cryptophyta sp. CCMP2293]
MRAATYEQFGCAIVASMRAHLLVRRCAVRGAKLDGIIAAVGGEAEVDSCDIQGCGESGVVASGVSTYETSDESGTVMVERSGLVLHSSCQIVENGGDMRGVTGGEVHPLFPAPG